MKIAIILHVFLLSLNVSCVCASKGLGIRVARFDPDSLIRSLRNFNLDTNFEENYRKKADGIKDGSSDSREADRLRRFYLDQQRLFINQLIIPSLNSYSKTTNRKTSKKADATNKTLHKKQWEYRVSDGSSSVKCSVLSNVPKGTVLVRPNGSKSEFISVPVLSSLLRTRPNILRILFPKHEIKDLNELYRYSSLQTLLISQLCSNDSLRRAIVTLSVLYGLKTAQEIILDLFFYTIRSKLFWNRTIYTFWSRSLSLPVPLLILTLNSILNEFINIISSLDAVLKDSLVQLEGDLMNRDLERKFSPVYVKDVRGNTRLHLNHFD